jgi:serine/threonine protein kinase
MNEFDLFQAALDLDDRAARQSFLQSNCGHDPQLLQRVEALLASHEGKSLFLNTPVVEQMAEISDADAAATMLAGGASTQDDEPATLHASPGSDPMPPHEDDSDEKTLLGYLEPSTKPGSLGRLAHYEVLEVIGRGAFGTVLRAFDEKLQRVVAIKVMSPEMASTSPARKRFIREAQASAAIRHENVVTVYAVEEKPIPYLVMDYVPGSNLQQHLDEQGPFDVPTVLRLGRQIAEGLAAAHAQDLIHRDVKPANILLESGAREIVKVTDFGLARAADDASVTQSGMIAGTPMYMAPEQLSGKKLDQRADLFSFGSVLYQMVSGRPPFRAATTLAVLKRLNEDTPRPIREIIPETPQWLCDIISKLHAKNPDERYQSAREVANVLANCESQLKAHSSLRDFSLIPRANTPPVAWWNWAAVVAILLPLLAIGLYALNRPDAKSKIDDQSKIIEPQEEPGAEPDKAVEATPVVIHETVKQEPLSSDDTNSIGMVFVKVPKGKSWLGGSKNELGNREVEIPDDFYLGKYEVTQEEWLKVMGENPSYFSRTGSGMDEVKNLNDADLKRLPVDSVTWNQCQLFIAKLNKSEAEKGWTYRLPKEVEWEYACRGGPMAEKLDSAFDFYFAHPTNTLILMEANFNNGTLDDYVGQNRPSRVGSFAPNALGLHDMHGNLWEWCEDSDKTFEGASGFANRGGSWGSPPYECNATYRAIRMPTNVSQSHGVRLVRVPSRASP